ncbi:hypothetical protein [Sphingomonas sp. F9_3S_D5_B_2]
MNILMPESWAATAERRLSSRREPLVPNMDRTCKLSGSPLIDIIEGKRIVALNAPP